MKKKDPLVSIILACYNDEENVEASIQSVLDQTYENFELIIIDDGSTDSSAEKIQNKTAQNEKIIVLHTQNKGLGAARNRGLKMVNGKYLAFLDSDDRLRPNFLSVLVSNLEIEPQCSGVVCKFDVRNTDGNEILTNVGWKATSLKISGLEAIKKMYIGGELSFTAWGKLFRFDAIRDLKFPENTWFEDRSYFLSFLLKTEFIRLQPQSLLINLIRPDSITRSTMTPKRITDLNNIFDLELKIIGSNRKIQSIATAHHISILLENFFLIYLDRFRIKRLKQVRRSQKSSIEEARTLIKQKKLSISLKQRALLFVMKLYSLPIKKNIEWVLALVLFRKRFKRVKTLKGVT